MDEATFSGGRALTGPVLIPGDKSISHRALLLSALSPERSLISGLGPGDDVVATGEALMAMGAAIASTAEGIQVEGFGVGGAREPHEILDMRNSGTALRTLLALCASGRGRFVLSGDRTLNQRPMLRVVAPLRAMGAEIHGRREGDLAPLTVEGRELTGANHVLAQASAQVKTALLLAGLAAAGSTTVRSPAPSRDHTERMLRWLGVDVTDDGAGPTVTGVASLPGAEWRIPADPSSAMFLIAAATLIPGSHIEIPDVNLNPLRIGAFEVLKAMGGNIEWAESSVWGGEPVGSVTVRSAELSSCDVGAEQIPSLVDEIPVLAVLAAFADGTSRFSGAEELKVKESNRIDSITEGLRSIGGQVETLEDGVVVHGIHRLSPGIVESRGDHRIAMAFAVAGLVGEAEITIRGWDSVRTSFPGFLGTMEVAQGR